MSFFDQLRDVGVVAVVRGKSADEAIAMSRALIDGGIKGIELTFTTPDCDRAIAEVAGFAPRGVLVGAGTVRIEDQVAAAAKAGARFVVSPHFEPVVAAESLRREIPFIPGALTPTEIVQCWDSGAAAVKIFPASAFGPEYLKAVLAPLPDIPLVPTGGISVKNMAIWFANGALALGMGGNLVRGSPENITNEARAVMAELNRIRGSQN